MRKSHSGFGLLSGISTSVGLSPAIFRLVIFLITGSFSKSPQVILYLPLLMRVCGEWFFWTFFAKTMEKEGVKNKVSWQKILAHPNVFTSLSILGIDLIADLVLIKLAIAGQVPVAYIGFALFATQALASPLQGFVSDLFSRKKAILFAASITMASLIVSLGVPIEGDNITRFLSKVIGISAMTPSFAIILLLCCKGLFGNTGVLARAAIGDIVRHMNTSTAE